MLDVIVAITLGAVTLLTAYLGVHVTLHPAGSQKARLAYKMGFLACAIVACVLIGLQTFRNNQAQAALQAELRDIKKNTERPPTVQVTTPSPVVTVVGPRPHTHISFATPTAPGRDAFMPFVPGKAPALNIGFSNTGDFGVIEHHFGALLVIAPREVEGNNVFRLHERDIPLKVVGGTLEAHTGEHAYHTFFAKTLTAKEASDINDGHSDICVVAKIQWLDETGKYQTDEAECFAIGPQGPNWYLSQDNNTEHVLP